MSVTIQHLQGLVARYSRYLHRVKAFLEKATRGFVTQIVEAQILNARTFAGTDIGLVDSFVCCTKNAAIQIARQVTQYLNSPTG